MSVNSLRIAELLEKVEDLEVDKTELKVKLAAAERENIKLRGQIVLLETDLKTLRHIRKGYTPEGK